MLLSQIIPKLKDTIKSANQKIMEIYQRKNDDFNIEIKSDKSPLTIADLESNKIICHRLEKLNKENNNDILIISEENKKLSYMERKSYELAWLIDPIDGTKEFIKKNGEFTTNIGLVKNNRVIFGIVGIPCENLIYWGGINVPSVKFNYETNELIFLKPRICKNPYILVTSRSHLNQETRDCIEDIKKIYSNVSIISSGTSIKMLMVAEGIANFYPRYAPTMEWDTCAAHGVLKGVQMNLLNMNNKELLYNKENLLNPYFKTS